MKSWADRQGLPSGVTGETYRGVLISEQNRMSEFATEPEHIQELRNELHNRFRRKGIPAVVFGTHQQKGPIRYAIYANAAQVAYANQLKRFELTSAVAA